MQRYVTGFAGRYIVRDEDTVDQMIDVAVGQIGKRLMYRGLIA